MFANLRWLRLTKRTLLVIDGQDYTEEVWVTPGGEHSFTERVPRRREYYGK